MVSLLIRLSLLFAAITGLILLLPGVIGLPAHLPAEVGDAITYFVNAARQFDWLLPINTLFTVFKLALLFELALFFFRVIRWLLHLLSGTSAGNS